MNRLIRTYPHVDEQGNRLWKTETCAKVCIQGHRDAFPEVCDHYENRLAGLDEAKRWGV